MKSFVFLSSFFARERVISLFFFSFLKLKNDNGSFLFLFFVLFFFFFFEMFCLFRRAGSIWERRVSSRGFFSLFFFSLSLLSFLLSFLLNFSKKVFLESLLHHTQNKLKMKRKERKRKLFSLPRRKLL